MFVTLYPLQGLSRTIYHNDKDNLAQQPEIPGLVKIAIPVSL